MIVEGTLAEASAEMPERISWDGRSCEELRTIASRGAHGGELYFAAVKELERRAHDSETELEDRQHKIVARRQGQTWLWAVLIAATSIAAIARVLGY
jgi:hypothetical protein